MARNYQAIASREELQRRGEIPIMAVSLGGAAKQQQGDERSPPTSCSDDGRPAKIRKVTRACDFCKLRKSRCGGDQPCAKCVIRDQPCVYSAPYTRGGPPAPQPSSAAKLLPTPSPTSRLPVSTLPASSDTVEPETSVNPFLSIEDQHEQSHPVPPSRASPELAMAEIEGQVFDTTSGLTFLHRAWKRLATHSTQAGLTAVETPADHQHIMMAGDKSLKPPDDPDTLKLPSHHECEVLLDLYFDVCIATYRMLHRPSVMAWLAELEDNSRRGNPIWHGIGPAKAAIVLVALAIAKSHQEKSKENNTAFDADSKNGDESSVQTESDRLFGLSVMLTDWETGYPKLESAQARLVQTLYLLTTSRFNRGWYMFGNALQIMSAIGLHRRVDLKNRSRRTPRMAPEDYIVAQCRLRTFWTAYILDNYLGVIFGRPRQLHDDYIDQAFPDRVNDEDMTHAGPVDGYEDAEDCSIDSLIFHAKIGQIIGSITKEVYSIKSHVSEKDRISAARRYIQNVQEWRSSLPAHLGLIRPSLLIPTHRRQATVLRLAYSHAIMHASRLFILSGKGSLQQNDEESPSDQECISAARAVLETVDNLAQDGPIFHAFWWTHYVTFCALVVTYVWEIQQKRSSQPKSQHQSRRAKLLDLAEKCQGHLARATAANSPSRRYAVILEEFRVAAIDQTKGSSDVGLLMARPSQSQLQSQHGNDINGTGPGLNSGQQPSSSFESQLLDGWRTSDWLDLDSSAFWPEIDLGEVPG